MSQRVTTEKLEEATQLLGLEFVTKKRRINRSNKIEKDFSMDQVGTVTLTLPNKETIILQRYHYKGDNLWELHSRDMR